MAQTKTKKIKPSKEQEEIIKSPLGEKSIVYAGPGSGKTRTIQERIEHVISKHKIKPSEIIVLSYSNTAADEIKERIILNSKVEGIEKLVTGTVHSFAKNQTELYIKSENPPHVLANEYEVYNYEEKLISEILNGEHEENESLEEYETFLEYLKIVRKNQSDYPGPKTSILNSNLDPNNFQTMLNDKLEEGQEKDEIHETLGISKKKLKKILETNFLKLMIQQNMHTFTTMVLLYKNILTDRQYLDYKTDFLINFKYLAVDEIQDLDDHCLDVVSTISNYIGSSIYCGDVAQAIYDAGNPLSHKSIKEYKMYTLNQSYRMTKGATEFTNILRKNLYSSEEMNMKPISKTNSKIHFNYTMGNTKEMVGYIQNIFPDLGKSTRKIGILTLKNQEVFQLSMALSRGCKDNFSNKIKDLNRDPQYNLLKYVSMYVFIKNILGNPMYSHLTHANKVIREFTSQQKINVIQNTKQLNNMISYMECLKNYIFTITKEAYTAPLKFHDIIPSGTFANFEDIISLSDKIKDTYIKMYSLIDIKTLDAVLKKARTVSLIVSRTKTPLTTVSHMVKYIFKLLNIDNIQEELIEKVASDILKFLHHASTGEHFYNFSNYSKKYNPNKGNIFVNTIHSSKGLEFDEVIVYLPIGKNNFVRFQNLKKLIYVATTRSKGNTHVFISIPKNQQKIPELIKSTKDRFFALTKTFSRNEATEPLFLEHTSELIFGFTQEQLDQQKTQGVITEPKAKKK